MGRVKLALPLKRGEKKNLEYPFPLCCIPPASAHTLGKSERGGIGPFCPRSCPSPEPWGSTGYSVCPNALCQGNAELSSPCPIPSHGPQLRQDGLERKDTKLRPALGALGHPKSSPSAKTTSPPGAWNEQSPRDSKR